MPSTDVPVCWEVIRDQALPGLGAGSGSKELLSAPGGRNICLHKYSPATCSVETKWAVTYATFFLVFPGKYSSLAAAARTAAVA